jgi:hypothetical protein
MGRYEKSPDRTWPANPQIAKKQPNRTLTTAINQHFQPIFPNKNENFVTKANGERLYIRRRSYYID